MSLTIHTSSTGPLIDQAVDALIVPLFSGEEFSPNAAAVDTALAGVLADMRQREEFRSELYQTAVLPTLGRLAAARVLLLGLGPRRELSVPAWQRAASAAARALAAHRLTSAALDLRDLGLPPADAARAAAEGVIMARFVPNPYRTAPRSEMPPGELRFLAEEAIDAAAREGEIIGHAKNMARELVNEPGNVITPSELARRAARAAQSSGFECEVLNEDDLRRMEMGAILAVTQGSAEPACLIVMRHTPREGAPALALVGKAVTFDTGGISLKPRENMQAMKGDMAGGAAVIGAMRAIAELKLPLNVVGIVPAADNMPGGRAWKPGDVITTRGGKTVETISTDAEGRMLLADALHYAQQLGAGRLVDIATLTGSCVVALGHEASGLYGNDEEWIRQVRDCGERAGERHWPMPLWSEYRSLNKSEIADLKNSAGRNAGSIGAAWFLREFVDDRPWAHLDIAGTSWQDKGTASAPAGPTGTGVGTFVNLVRELAAEG